MDCVKVNIKSLLSKPFLNTNFEAKLQYDQIRAMKCYQMAAVLKEGNIEQKHIDIALLFMVFVSIFSFFDMTSASGWALLVVAHLGLPTISEKFAVFSNYVVVYISCNSCTELEIVLDLAITLFLLCALYSSSRKREFLKAFSIVFTTFCCCYMYMTTVYYLFLLDFILRCYLYGFTELEQLQSFSFVISFVKYALTPFV